MHAYWQMVLRECFDTSNGFVSSDVGFYERRAYQCACVRAKGVVRRKDRCFGCVRVPASASTSTSAIFEENTIPNGR